MKRLLLVLLALFALPAIAQQTQYIPRLKVDTLTANNVYYAQSLATAGAGTAASPWTGWETPLQTLMASMATTGGTVIFPPGKVFNQSTTVRFPRSAVNWIKLVGHGATIVQQTSALSSFSINRVADYDNFNWIWIEGFTIDSNNTGGLNQIVFAGAGQRINYNHVVIRDIEIINAKTDYNQGTNHRGLVNIGSTHVSNSEATQTTITDVTVENIKAIGGNYGVLVVCGGPGTTSASNVNCFIDNVTITNFKQNMTPLQTQNWSASCVQVGSRGKVGHTRVSNIECEGSGDDGVEINGAQNASLDHITCTNVMNACVVGINYSPPVDLDNQTMVVHDLNVNITSAMAGTSCSGVCTAKGVQVTTPVGHDWNTLVVDGLNYRRSDGKFGVAFYAIPEAAPAWGASTAYVAGNEVTNDGGKTYVAIVSGTSAGSGGPTGTGSTITDGGVTWTYISATSISQGSLRHARLNNIDASTSNITYSTAVSYDTSWVYNQTMPYDDDGDFIRSAPNDMTLTNSKFSHVFNRTGPNPVYSRAVWITPISGNMQFNADNVRCTIGAKGTFAGERSSCMEFCSGGSNCTVNVKVNNMRVEDAGAGAATNRNGVYAAFLGNAASASASYLFTNSDFSALPTNASYDLWNYGSSSLLAVNNKYKNIPLSSGQNLYSDSTGAFTINGATPYIALGTDTTYVASRAATIVKSFDNTGASCSNATAGSGGCFGGWFQADHTGDSTTATNRDGWFFVNRQGSAGSGGQGPQTAIALGAYEEMRGNTASYPSPQYGLEAATSAYYTGTGSTAFGAAGSCQAACSGANCGNATITSCTGMYGFGGVRNTGSLAGTSLIGVKAYAGGDPAAGSGTLNYTTVSAVEANIAKAAGTTWTVTTANGVVVPAMSVPSSSANHGIQIGSVSGASTFNLGLRINAPSGTGAHSIRLYNSSGGYTDIDPAASASNFSFGLQAASGNAALTNQVHGVLSGAEVATFVNTNTYYIPGTWTSAALITSAANAAGAGPGVAVTYRHLTCRTATAIATGTWTFTLNVAGSDRTLTCSMTSSATSCSDTAHTYTASAGDAVAYKMVPTSTPTVPGYVNCTVTYSLE